MSKGIKKTVLERQLQTYNGFLYEIRQANRNGETRKMPVTMSEQIANSIEIAKAENAKSAREKKIAEMIALKPIVGNPKGMDPAEYKKRGEEYSAWNKAYHKLIKSLK